MMEADMALSDGYHHTVLQLILNLCENLLNQHRDLGTP
jgi:hypothetical protein